MQLVRLYLRVLRSLGPETGLGYRLAVANTVMSLESLLFGIIGLVAGCITLLVIWCLLVERDEEAPY